MDSEKKKILKKSTKSSKTLSVAFDNILEHKEHLATSQLNAILDKYFDKKLNDVNQEIYVVKQITMELTRQVLLPVAKTGEEPTIQNVTTQFNVPLITLVPLNYLLIENTNIDINGKITIKTSDQNPLPNGIFTIIDAFTKAIQPISY